TQPFSLHFEPPDLERFPALGLAYDVAERGGTLGAVFNTANEAAVDAFASGNIGFGEISRLVSLTIDSHRLQSDPSLADLLRADGWARDTVGSLIARRSPDDPPGGNPGPIARPHTHQAR